MFCFVLNRELGASFDPSQFEHVAVWNDDKSHIEMRLRSLLDQTVAIKELDMEVHFCAGEDLLTETSAKFTREGVEKELSAGGPRRGHHVGGPRRVLAHPRDPVLLMRAFENEGVAEMASRRRS